MPSANSLITLIRMSRRSEHLTLWVDRRLVLRPSPIHGVGTFALEPISAGEALISMMGGLIYTDADRAAGKVELASALYNEELLPDGERIATPKSFHYYLNHSGAPNAVETSTFATTTHYVALRDIGAGEEITVDYGPEGANLGTSA